MGHSLGGIFTLCSLFENAHNPLFKNNIAASNSIGLGTNNYVFIKEEEAAAQINDLPVKLFIAFGSLEGAEMNILHNELHQRLLERNYPSLKVTLEDYPKTHASVVFPSFKNGLSYVFNN